MPSVYENQNASQDGRNKQMVLMCTGVKDKVSQEPYQGIMDQILKGFFLFEEREKCACIKDQKQGFWN